MTPATQKSLIIDIHFVYLYVAMDIGEKCCFLRYFSDILGSSALYVNKGLRSHFKIQVLFIKDLVSPDRVHYM